MKIKVCIANYGDSQLWCLHRMLEEFKTYKKYEVDITIYSTVDIPNYRCILFDNSIGGQLPFMPRKEIYHARDRYDLFLYNENDHLITEDNIDAYLEVNKNIQLPYCPGFYRYELKDDKKILLDWNPYFGQIKSSENKHMFTVHNVHQGCYLLTKEQLSYCIDSKQFLVPPHEGPYGILEQGASDPYNNCGLNKVFPKDMNLLSRLGIQHLPVKYSLKYEWLHHGITIDKL